MTAPAGTGTVFEGLKPVAGNLAESASGLRRFAEQPKGRSGPYAALARCRRAASSNRAAAALAYGQSFGFRRDPRAIARLIEPMCSIPPLIERAAARMRVCWAGSPPPEVVELARRIERAAAILLEAAGPIEKTDPAGLSRAAAGLRAEIEEADAIGSRGLSDLFEGNPDPLEVLKGKDVYHLLGDILRRFQVAARRLEDMAQGAG